MAINFEAANMAGYNNPQIEVFEANCNENGEIVAAPTKSNILGCLKRGSIPFIRVTFNSDGILRQFLFTFAGAREIAGNSQVSFTTVISFGETGDLTTDTLVYGPGDDSLPSLV